MHSSLHMKGNITDQLCVFCGIFAKLSPVDLISKHHEVGRLFCMAGQRSSMFSNY